MNTPTDSEINPDIDAEFSNEYAARPWGNAFTKVMWAVKGTEPGLYGYEPTFKTNAEAHAFKAGARHGYLARVVRHFPYNPDVDGPRDIGDGGHAAKMRAADAMIEAMRPTSYGDYGP